MGLSHPEEGAPLKTVFPEGKPFSKCTEVHCLSGRALPGLPIISSLFPRSSPNSLTLHQFPVSLCQALIRPLTYLSKHKPSSLSTPSPVKPNPVFLLTWLGTSRGWLQGLGVWSEAWRTPEVEAERPRR